ncbi:hypothetical protein AB4059_08950 [Lysobacter sp. 2RAF19]
MRRLRLIQLLPLALVLASPLAMAAGKTDCKLKFSLAGWSAFYKTASGDGTITCDNGQKMAVHIVAKGGGLTFGKSKIENGTGEFSGVKDIHELLGSYAQGEAHAGAVKSSGASAMTKGEVSLALAGTGEGWDLGVSFGKFTISKR